MKLLAIETSTDACSVGLVVDGQTLIDHRIAAQRHGELVLGMADALMAEAGLRPAQLDALIYGRGPGSFTGVRIGVAAAQGIALGADIGVVGISTLQAIAQGCFREFNDASVAVSVDARMDEVYFCEYCLDEGNVMQALIEEQISAPTDMSWQTSSVWAGSGAQRYAHVVHEHFSADPLHIRTDCLPHACDLLQLGAVRVQCDDVMSADAASPVYLRNKVAMTTEERAGRRPQGFKN